MRVLKFRAWDTERQKMSGNFELKLIGEFTSNELRNNVNNLILMQFTGLKDKNGKEVHEGDILKIYASAGEVFTIVSFENCSFRTNAWGAFDGKEPLSYWLANGCIMEVVGNIYENPEFKGGESS